MRVKGTSIQYCSFKYQTPALQTAKFIADTNNLLFINIEPDEPENQKWAEKGRFIPTKPVVGNLPIKGERYSFM